MAQPLFCVQLVLEASGRLQFHQPRGPGVLRRLLQELCGEEMLRLPQPHHRSIQIQIEDYVTESSRVTIQMSNKF